MEFQLIYFKYLKIMLLKCCTQYASKFGKLNSGHRTGKVSFYSNPKEKQCSHYCTIALISYASKVMLKILQARLQRYVNWELPDVQAGLKKDRGVRSQDGGGVGRGEHFLPHKFIKRAFKRRVNSTKQLLNAGRGHQAPRKAAQLFERR